MQKLNTNEKNTDIRIFVEPSNYKLKNIGDMAMLQVAITRLGNLWPNAKIHVLTDVPGLLLTLCPNAIPIDTTGRRIWFNYTFLLGCFSAALPRCLQIQVSKLEGYLRRHHPSLVEFILKFKLKLPGMEGKALRSFLTAVSQADLMIVSGMGCMTDVFPNASFTILDTLRLTIRSGAVTSMLGQGMGPIHNSKLYSLAQAILPQIDFIALREKRASLPILNNLRVSSDRLMTTGDDAIELAYNARTMELGSGIGINIRIAQYSGVSSVLLETVRSALQEIAKKLDAPLIPTPIDRASYKGYSESDSAMIQKLLKGYDDSSDGGKDLDTPLNVIEQVGRCRVVVTGSYHAGVFALSQGIPVVALAKTEYYQNKFLGLKEQFGIGCEVVLLNNQHLREELFNEVNRLWQLSEELRPQLLESAKQQVALGHKAYQQVFKIFQTRNRRK